MLHGPVLSLPPAGVSALVGPGEMAGGDIKPATQNRLRWKRRKLADQQQKHFLGRILGQRRIAKNTMACRLYHRPVLGDEVRARRLTQGKHTVPGTLRRAALAFGLVVNGHTILLPRLRKVCVSFIRVFLQDRTMSATPLSQKSIPVNERLIFALDVPTIDEARQYVKNLGDTVIFYKLGLQIFMAGGYYDLIDHLVGQGKKVFVDLKFFDVPETVAAAVRQLRNRKVDFTTVHGNDEILKAAVKEKTGVKILAVTVLTSFDQHDLNDLGFKCEVEKLVLSRARRALEIGCDGVISSGMEAPRLREHLGDNFLIVTPGIRPVENRPA